MGMAASQARYLQLTARKTNVEYQGQQINQQRTALANESAGLFNQLLGLDVPTAPSSSAYTKTQYTFSDGANDYTITNISNLRGDPDYNAEVTYYYTAAEYTGIALKRADLGVKNVAGAYWLTDGAIVDPVNKTKLTQCTAADKDYDTDYAALLQICKDNPDINMATDLGYDPDTQTLGTVENAYKYTNAKGVTYYYDITDLENMPADGSAAALSSYYASDVDEKVYNTQRANITKEDSGRYSAIQLEDYSATFDLTTTSSTDENAYNDAMNEYTYQQALYQKRVQDINAKTEAIEAEDRTLELQLKQLDTEQEALQTEMESVKKVIDKNIDQTFKTFSS